MQPSHFKAEEWTGVDPWRLAARFGQGPLQNFLGPGAPNVDLIPYLFSNEAVRGGRSFSAKLV